MEKRDYYEVLEVEKTATVEEIKKAYLSFYSTDGNCVDNSICLPISVIEIPEEEIDVQTESVDTTHKRILPDKRKVHQSRITVHSLSAPPNEIQTYRCET